SGEPKESGGLGAWGGRRPLYGPAAPVLEGLFAEQGLTAGEWWPFLVQEEGKALPGGVETLSGFVLTQSGEVYGWWLDWAPVTGTSLAGPNRGGTSGSGWGGSSTRVAGVHEGAVPGATEGRYVLDRWWRVGAPEREFAGDAEYRRARRHLGLT
ncbi:MAG: hypothetical protein M3442_16695, partial [Chloroflexota bacterium]|nr:hypothetical protein [Chloroflexota bacterium]